MQIDVPCLNSEIQLVWRILNILPQHLKVMQALYTQCRIVSKVPYQNLHALYLCVAMAMWHWLHVHIITTSNCQS